MYLAKDSYFILPVIVVIIGGSSSHSVWKNELGFLYRWVTQMYINQYSTILRRNNKLQNFMLCSI